MVNPLTPKALGTTGMHVSLLSLGTVKFGRDRGVKYPTPVHIPSDVQARSLLSKAWDLGLNLLDTAPAYGNSEQRLGELIDPAQPWLICTKVGEEFDPVSGQSRHNFSAEHTQLSVERSLRRLGRDCLDIVLIHSDGEDEQILTRWGTLHALQDLKAKGLIRAVGMSHKSVHGAQLALTQGADVLMATLNRQDTQDAKIIEQASAAGCGILIKKALASGFGSSEDLKFVADHKGVDSIVIGTTNERHLEQNVLAITDT